MSVPLVPHAVGDGALSLHLRHSPSESSNAILRWVWKELEAERVDRPRPLHVLDVGPSFGGFLAAQLGCHTKVLYSRSGSPLSDSEEVSANLPSRSNELMATRLGSLCPVSLSDIDAFPRPAYVFLSDVHTITPWRQTRVALTRLCSRSPSTTVVVAYDASVTAATQRFNSLARSFAVVGSSSSDGSSIVVAKLQGPPPKGAPKRPFTVEIVEESSFTAQQSSVGVGLSAVPLWPMPPPLSIHVPSASGSRPGGGGGGGGPSGTRSSSGAGGSRSPPSSPGAYSPSRRPFPPYLAVPPPATPTTATATATATTTTGATRTWTGRGGGKPSGGSPVTQRPAPLKKVRTVYHKQRLGAPGPDGRVSRDGTTRLVLSVSLPHHTWEGLRSRMSSTPASSHHHRSTSSTAGPTKTHSSSGSDGTVYGKKGRARSSSAVTESKTLVACGVGVAVVVDSAPSPTPVPDRVFADVKGRAAREPTLLLGLNPVVPVLQVAVYRSNLPLSRRLGQAVGGDGLMRVRVTIGDATSDSEAFRVKAKQQAEEPDVMDVLMSPLQPPSPVSSPSPQTTAPEPTLSVASSLKRPSEQPPGGPTSPSPKGDAGAKVDGVGGGSPPPPPPPTKRVRITM